MQSGKALEYGSAFICFCGRENQLQVGYLGDRFHQLDVEPGELALILRYAQNLAHINRVRIADP
ncbi:MAG: hypothetical protein JSW66_07080, partial [Phycisphaerales bacterium]